jgi:hypothetical protein
MVDEDEKINLLRQEEDEKMEVLQQKDSRGKKERKKVQKKLKEKEASGKSEMKKMKAQMAEMQKLVDEMKKEKAEGKVLHTKGFALGFSKEEYLSLGYLPSAQYVNNTIAANLLEKLEKTDKFPILKKLNFQVTGVRTCAKYNRGEDCKLGKWHSSPKRRNQNLNDRETYSPMNSTQPAREELRVHGCTLCSDAMGIVSGHPVLECPWLDEDTWKDN